MLVDRDLHLIKQVHLPMSPLHRNVVMVVHVVVSELSFNIWAWQGAMVARYTFDMNMVRMMLRWNRRRCSKWCELRWGGAGEVPRACHLVVSDVEF